MTPAVNMINPQRPIEIERSPLTEAMLIDSCRKSIDRMER